MLDPSLGFGDVVYIQVLQLVYAHQFSFSRSTHEYIFSMENIGTHVFASSIVIRYFSESSRRCFFYQFISSCILFFLLVPVHLFAISSFLSLTEMHPTGRSRLMVFAAFTSPNLTIQFSIFSTSPSSRSLTKAKQLGSSSTPVLSRKVLPPCA